MRVDYNQLTEEQKIGALKIKNFLNSEIVYDNPLTRVIVLKGQAGTGKTTMLRNALEDILIADQNAPHESVKNKFEADLFNQGVLGCVGVTVAHKAKKVLNRSIPITTTYASYFGMVKDNDEYGNEIFKPNPDLNKRNSSLHKKPHRVAVHDEVSMYDEDMINYILNNTDPLTKIILVGDPGQLPPIKEIGEDGWMSDDDSPAFEWFKETMITLTKKVRQTEGNPIIELTDIIYEEIFENKDIGRVLDMLLTPNYVNGIGYQTLEYKSLLKEYLNVTNDNFLNSKILSYTNDNVNFYNKTIRDFIYKNPHKKIIEGELVYMNNTFQFSRKGFLYNSDEYLIESISIITEKEIECYQCFVSKEGHEHLKNERSPFFLIPTEKGEVDFKRNEQWLKNNIYSNDNPAYRKKAWGRYLSYVNSFAKVSYGYCYTAHKAQGSTFKNVFIDINDTISLQKLSDKRKLQAIYTAITRASHSAYFLK